MPNTAGSKFIDSDLAECEGNRDKRVAKRQELYEITLDKVGEEIAQVEQQPGRARNAYTACAEYLTDNHKGHTGRRGCFHSPVIIDKREFDHDQR
jgi:uncharacterized protein YjbJ (UPF0337 family)